MFVEILQGPQVMSFVDVSLSHTRVSDYPVGRMGAVEFFQNNLSREHMVPLPVGAFVYTFGCIKLLDKLACSHLIHTLKIQKHSVARSFQLQVAMSREGE